MLKDLFFFLGQFYGSESNRHSRLNSQYPPWDGMGPLYNESFGTGRSVKTYMNMNVYVGRSKIYNIILCIYIYMSNVCLYQIINISYHNISYHIISYACLFANT